MTIPNTETVKLTAEHKEKLKGFFKQIDTSMDIIDDERENLKEIYSAAAAMGFDKAALKSAVAKRRKDKDARERAATKELMVDAYMEVLLELAI